MGVRKAANGGFFRLAEFLQRPDSHRYILKSAASLHLTIVAIFHSGGLRISSSNTFARRNGMVSKPSTNFDTVP